ncbi:hypothetical protein GCM10023215_41170 [Pseudonocardia yuanmonensis]|uniref:non-specific serine/threonine protein kinase n=1 Tax=Pseudonocardia yuanmonensis TaxID=1095914 RepID=A0ABP8X066_9PSEU
MTSDTPKTETGGAMIGPYRLEHLLGRGGMGEVHRAFDTRRSRTVALKLLSPQFAQDPQYRERFRRESHNAAALSSPHVVPIHDFGEIDGRLFLDMRLIEGRGLDEILAEAPLEPARAVAIVGQIAEALADAHGHGLVHRDVKPSNVIVGPSDFVYLLDFGISRSLDDVDTALTQAGATVGTLAYMAPERFEGGKPDARSDIYALGCVLAECLTSRRPFDATSLPSLMRAHFASQPALPSVARPGLSPALDGVVLRALAKQPEDRFPTARDLAAAAHQALYAPPPTAALPLPERPDAGDVRKEERPRRRFRPVLAAGAVLALLVAVGAGVALGRVSTTQAAVGTSATPAPTTVAAPIATTAPTIAPATASPNGGSGNIFDTRSAKEKTSSFTYTIETNYPALIGYTDARGDQVSSSQIDGPWTLVVPTGGWGKDATPSLHATSTSSKGDTTLTCTITDDKGAVVVTQTKATAHAAVICLSFNY